MKFIRYFFYIALNWNLRIAWHLLQQEIKGEKKYGINTTGADELQSLEKQDIDIEHATIYMPSPYGLLEWAFQKVDMGSYKHIVDIGSGKGRALCVAAHFGATKLTGVDFSKSFCQKAIENLSLTKQKFPNLQYSIFTNDAFYFSIPPDVDCIFLFNPFDDVIMSGVLENIEISLQKNARPITIIYFNPLQQHLFLSAGYRQIFHTKKLKYLEAIILKK
ncbi:MAG: class I SAM-dependent methyltransferase [Chitinophagaceae bacterium]|jgi:SAM-dependent methyltransferase|nr:class I SAM-dependent methyltransferase [Chitinophagaceae bacterium]MBP6046890.1 class I SAM-dependent methyltransferase [Ferruginibacter sp.]NMD30010.1 class I SAM-dependent methyltransferase [Bacteroidota bacterium]MBK7347232.1 class I SAM-dependent methyltransferase [Chitinophagaceae bacterium]MBK7733896.1 class I SAM-dependent methyltransferase [Chitinophagaceae bacterium]